MKVLYIGHAYIPRINREKIRQLAKLKDVELYLIVPTEWSHYLKKFVAEPETENSLYSFAPLQTLFQGKEVLYTYFPNLTIGIQRIKPDIIHVEQGSLALSFAQANVNKNIFAPHAKSLFFTWWNLPYDLKPHWAMVERFNLKNSDYAITGNQDAKNILRDRGFNKPIKVLPQLGVDTDLYRRYDVSELKTGLGLENEFVIGYVGRLSRDKGLLTLLEASSMISKRHRLLFVGRGELKSKMITFSQEKGIEERLCFVDTVPHQEVPHYLNCMDVMVLPSLTTEKWKEQFGHVLIEAMACETPVVGSSSAEIPNVIGDAGMVFDEGDPFDLANNLRLLMEDEQRREILAKQGRQRVQRHFTHKRIAEETYSVYQELLS